MVIGIVIVVSLLAATVPIISDHHSDTPLDVFVIAGQSNTYPTINTDPETASPVPETGTSYYFGTADHPTYNKNFELSTCKMYDLNNDGVARIGGLFPSFAAQYHAKTGHSVYLIDTGLSGQNIASFLPGGVNYEWPNQVIDAAMKAIPSGYDVNVRGYIWIQGEGDWNVSTQTYEIRMINLYSLYSGGDLAVKLPTCFICKVRDYYAHPSEAQKWLVDNNIPGFEMASTLPDTFTQENGLLGSDSVHYTQAGFNALGVDLANNIPEPEVDTPTDYTPIMLLFVPLVLAALIVVVIRSRID